MPAERWPITDRLPTVSAQLRTESKYDLRVDLGAGRNEDQRQVLYYHRLVALTCLTTRYNCSGRRLAHDVVVRPEGYGSYQVDQRDWNNLDCRLRNLELLPVGRHLPYERFWLEEEGAEAFSKEGDG